MRIWNHGVAVLGLSLAAGLTGCHGSCCQRSWCQNECEPCASCNTCDDCNSGYGAPSYHSMPAYPVYDPPGTPQMQAIQPTPDSVPPTPALPSAAAHPQSPAPTSGGYYYQPMPASQPNMFERIGGSMKRTFQRLTRRNPAADEVIYVTGYHGPSSAVGQRSSQSMAAYQQVGFHGGAAAASVSSNQSQPVLEDDTNAGSQPLISPPSTRIRPGSSRRF